MKKLTVILLFQICLAFQWSTCNNHHYRVTEILNSPLTLIGEGPFYDGNSQSFYWTDLKASRIFHMDIRNEKQIYSALIHEPVVSFIIPLKHYANSFIIGAGHRVLLIEWDGFTSNVQTVCVLIDLEDDTVRFNDGKIDSRGRLYLGTMIFEKYSNPFGNLTERIGSLYRYSIHDGLVELLANVGLSNGLAFDNVRKAFYYVDSFDLNLKRFDYDEKTGDISNMRIFTDLTNIGIPIAVVPDGLTIDANGTIYLAMFGASTILIIDPDHGNIVNKFILPTKQITSMTFGSKSYEHPHILDTLYVTSASWEHSLGLQHSPAGRLFTIDGITARGTENEKFIMDKLACSFCKK